MVEINLFDETAKEPIGDYSFEEDDDEEYEELIQCQLCKRMVLEKDTPDGCYCSECFPKMIEMSQDNKSFDRLLAATMINSALNMVLRNALINETHRWKRRNMVEDVKQEIYEICRDIEVEVERLKPSEN